MQQPRSLVLLGAIYSFTAAAAGSLPRGVGPECQLAPLPQHPLNGLLRDDSFNGGPLLTPTHSCIVLRGQIRIHLHHGCFHQAQPEQSQRQHVRLPRRLRRARHRGLRLHRPPLASTAAPRLALRQHECRKRAPRLLVRQQGPRWRLRPLCVRKRWRLRLRPLLRRL